jgi:hypothetical protein
VLLQHAPPLADCQPYPRPVFGHAVEDATRFVEVAASEQHVNHTLPVARPLLDLVEVAPSAWVGSSVSSSDQSLIARR